MTRRKKADRGAAMRRGLDRGGAERGAEMLAVLLPCARSPASLHIRLVDIGGEFAWMRYLLKSLSLRLIICINH